MVVALILAATACGSDDTDAAPEGEAQSSETAESEGLEADAVDVGEGDGAMDETPVPDESNPDASGTGEEGSAASGADSEGEAGTLAFGIEIWADNWMAVYVNGELIGEDSVPITTERSFNSEAFTFQASYPFTVAILAKDFKETDSGLEYIGEENQQMGDGGLIAQVVDLNTGETVLKTDSSWASFVVHRAPLNTDCEKDPNPDDTCESEIAEEPEGWTDAGFDDSGWAPATEWTAADVDPKDGYDDVIWDPSATLIWGADLEVDNTILFRQTATGG